MIKLFSGMMSPPNINVAATTGSPQSSASHTWLTSAGGHASVTIEILLATSAPDCLPPPNVRLVYEPTSQLVSAARFTSYEYARSTGVFGLRSRSG